ncbi:hypothetical protein INT45_003981 [Circinella minor]|uniref:Uncharacterized protein n=1 Tax=Circinella minor TaxID=1195481 RepID=A0A8H7VHF0_9FUNG|nr:hypothetical protein INT45_003981 [Circinella minor]
MNSSISSNSIKSHIESLSEVSDQYLPERAGWEFSCEENNNADIWNQDKTAIIPELTVQYNGSTLFQPYDPKFLPPLKFNDNEELYKENGYYFDLVHEVVNLKMTHIKLLQNIDKTRKLLANRITYRLLPLMWKQKNSQDRQELVRKYIATHIHDTYLTDDKELHLLIEQYYKNLLSAGFPHTLPSRDMNF